MPCSSLFNILSYNLEYTVQTLTEFPQLSWNFNAILDELGQRYKIHNIGKTPKRIYNDLLNI